MLGRECKSCGVWKPAVDFHKHKYSKDGIYPRCKECRHTDSVEEWNSKSIERKIYDRAKSRAKRFGIEFTIELEDIIVPDVCPILKIPFQEGGNGKLMASIDRIDNSKGYIKGNIAIISAYANQMKANLDEKHIENLLNYIKSARNS